MAKNNLFLVLLFALSSTIVNAQSYTHQQESLPCVRKKFTIVAHVFKDSLGAENITREAIDTIFIGVNRLFKPIEVSFEVCEYKVWPAFEHDTLYDDFECAAMIAKYNYSNRINFYFSNQMKVEPYAAGTVSGGEVFIDKDEGLDVKVFAHELGHLFSLGHTFGGDPELVNGDNCQTAGDGICDTPADPFVLGAEQSSYQENCRFINTQQDANGEYYNPDLGNVMSYYDCPVCGFTHDQLLKMAQAILANRMKMW